MTEEKQDIVVTGFETKENAVHTLHEIASALIEETHKTEKRSYHRIKELYDNLTCGKMIARQLGLDPNADPMLKNAVADYGMYMMLRL